MFVPLHDNTPLKVIRFQYVTGALIIINVVAFLMTGAFTSEQTLWAVATGYGIVPVELLHVVDAGQFNNPVPEPLTLITYQFLHGGWMHLISNMAFLWVFADNIEDAFGHFGFLLFYLLCGIAAGLLHTFMQPDSGAPLIGASGAVSGVLAAYLLLYPKARVWILLFMRIPLPISAFWALSGWFALQLLSIFLSSDNEVQVAWWAHIGGFLAGLILTFVLRSRLLVRTSS
ncbi:rhomboid family intramembrane serine protease [Aestuariivirga sp. YIM B02566]|uniref:Rhomboid family intramembrane serine protease n=1 Tax=Taklimakanibacter albus TaxID=2800327 RepID=A0ACC5QWY7_9HYPH|nr:rhomboid family intramembrane serine protease [Aestuariivirga sp. YIM B02566]MBK1864862.1 rhomboid family intramembrane serine protease [Aestuariivirga sp. YIM B02566]